ncbi:MAG: nucleotidyltransferase family protein [Coxiellaceae bacterium]|nr:nucleotidyltransferase family protein [Coxiellaceae bacterium]
MILAAGSGKRLGGITQRIPKPLVEVGGETLIAHQVRCLASAGFTDLVINVCYMASSIIDALGDGQRFGCKIEYSYEQEVGGLETGGGVYQALPLLGDQPFLVTSADIYTDFPYEQLQQPMNAAAHLVLVPNPVYHSDGDFALDAQGAITLQGEKWNYAGIGILTRMLFDGVTERKFSISSRLMPAIEQHTVTGELYKGAWYNVGTPTELDALSQYVASSQRASTKPL